METALAQARGARKGRVAAFLNAYLGHLDAAPALLKLDALGYGVLDRNLAPDARLQFKTAFLQRMIRAGAVVEEALGLPPRRGVPLLMRSFALTRGLWQSSTPEGPPAPWSPAYEEAGLYPDFHQELREALTEYWRGALAGEDEAAAARRR